MGMPAIGPQSHAGRFLIPRRQPWFTERLRAIPRFHLWSGATVVGLVVLRLLLPYVLCWTANLLLGFGDIYRGHVHGISLDLWRGACQLHGLEVGVRKDDAAMHPLFAVELVDVAVDWERVWHGQLRFLVDAQGSRITLEPSASSPAPSTADGRLLAAGR